MAQRIDLMVKHRDLQEGPYRSVTQHNLVPASSVRLDQVRAPSRLGRVELEPVAESPGAFADP
jgi:hypothetical protein